ncbi:hypothetical protein J2Z60_001740 [Lactobacillus colini]|uniref:Uncharacterized protein n=1 Tax=Lactobacillus colini TaxID=1819254 RepID=A0ABS4MFT8_9LACO|nr:hypothetical protein [Lactobacillus colini]MBP2058555.1 hypothetical protein [Lactobacillus colini]
MNNVELLGNGQEASIDSNLLKSSHKSRGSFISRNDENIGDSFGIEMEPQENGDLLIEEGHFHLPKACCCCVSISTGAAGLKERK